MIKLSSSKLRYIAAGLASIAAGAVLGQSAGQSSGCGSAQSSGGYCCYYPNGVQAAFGAGQSSANACCVDCTGASANGGYVKYSVGGQVSWCKVIQFNADKYPVVMKARWGKTCLVTSPCSEICK